VNPASGTGRADAAVAASKTNAADAAVAASGTSAANMANPDAQAVAALRQELCVYARKTVANRLVVGPGGNISARLGGKMYLSPSGFALDEVRPEQWVEVDVATGEVTDNGLRPSSEVLMHLYLYRKNPDIHAVVHTHPPYCIALTLVTDRLPVMFPDQAALVGRTAYVPYVLPTTAALAEAVAAQASEAGTLLLGNHGLVTVGRNLREAYYRTEVVEESAKIYLIAASVREPRALTPAEVEEIASLESEAYRIRLLQQMR
jgi:L-fuculose-phosphate aldolase